MLAIVDATRVGSSAASVQRLCSQLSGCGATVTVLSAAHDLPDVLRADSDNDVVVASGDVVLHGHAMRNFLAASGSRALISRHDQTGALPTRIDRDRVVSVGSAYHQVSGPNAWSLDVVGIGRMQRVAVADSLEQWVETRGQEVSPTSLVAVALVRSGRPVRAFDIRELQWRRARDDATALAAAEELAGLDEETLAMNSAVKAEDEAFTTFFVSPYSRYIARWCARRAIRPNTVTIMSILLGALAAVGFALGTRGGLIAGAVLLQVSFMLDCVDGQLARLTAKFSAFGAWLDITFDRAKEYAVYAGLAVGATRSGLGDWWAWALAALVIRVSRHLVDFSFASRGTTSAPKVRDLADPSDGLVATGGSVERTSRRMDASSMLRWARKIAVLPFGQRLALISVTAAFWDARVTFYTLVPWAGVAGLYSTTGRVLRSLAR